MLSREAAKYQLPLDAPVLLLEVMEEFEFSSGPTQQLLA
jgi:hypothetical protein